MRRKAQEMDSDVFETRLLFQRTICMVGEGAAQKFYDTDHFQRKGAAPARVKKTLFGEGGVQGLDGEAHVARKRMFMSLMTPAHIRDLVGLFADEWYRRLDRWQRSDRVVVYEEANEVLCRAVCMWSSVPLPEQEIEQRTSDLVRMIEGSGAVGLRHWRGRRARSRAERWIEELVRQVRSGELHPDHDSALHVISHFKDHEGRRLTEKEAAVEVLNILRPTVAVSRYITFAALALNDHPGWRQRLQEDRDEELTWFIQEVRRFYPFFPIAAAVVRRPFDWHGLHFPEGRRVILDLFGTNRDPRIWSDPNTFRPERFKDWNGSPFNFIPQGGGEFVANHRCAGEWITIELTRGAVSLLVSKMKYEVPKQDLSINMKRIPAIPRSRFVIRDVQRLPHKDALA